MNKRCKNNFSDNKEDGDLADVNELELAKDGEGSELFGNVETGKTIIEDKHTPVNSSSEILKHENITKDVSENIEEAVPQQPKRSGADFIIVNVESKPQGELPTPVDKDNSPSAPENLEQPHNAGAQTDAKDGEDQAGKEEQDKEPPIRKRKGVGRAGAVYIAVIVICLFASVGVLVFGALRGQTSVVQTVNDTEVEQTETQEIPVKTVSEQMSAEEIYELGVKASVTVRCATDGGEVCYSGVGVFGDGYVATLYEAIDGAQSAEVVLWDGKVYPAELVGGNSTVNLVLLKTQAEELEYVSVGNSEELAAGNSVYAIGNVGDGKFASSMLACRVSFAQRLLELTAYDGTERRAVAVQISGITDAALRGCPIFNGYGEAVAMTLVCESDSAAGFAIPLDIAVKILETIRLGQEPSAEQLRELAFVPATLGIMGEQAQVGEIWGVSVVDFSTEGNDASMKLRQGDLIFRINDTLIPDTTTLRDEIGKHRPGESVEVFVYRQEQRLSFFVELS